MKPTMPLTVRTYQKTDGKIPFNIWLSKLDQNVQMVILGRIRNMSSGTLGDYKRVAPGVFEARVNCGPGFRIYFGLAAGGKIVILLIGGDKSSQTSDIEKAQNYWLDYKERT